jgi:hypothetical protein
MVAGDALSLLQKRDIPYLRLDFDEISGNFTDDIKGLVGTFLGNPARVPSGISLNSDGVTYVDINTSLRPVWNTVETEAIVNALPGGSSMVSFFTNVNGGSTAGNPLNLHLRNDGLYCMYSNTGPSGWVGVGPVAIPFGVPLHIVGTIDPVSGVISLYVNGVKTSNTYAVRSLSGIWTSSDYVIGRRWDAGQSLNGIIYNTVIYEGVLTAAQVAEHYSASQMGFFSGDDVEYYALKSFLGQ